MLRMEFGGAFTDSETSSNSAIHAGPVREDIDLAELLKLLVSTKAIMYHSKEALWGSVIGPIRD